MLILQTFTSKIIKEIGFAKNFLFLDTSINPTKKKKEKENKKEIITRFLNKLKIFNQSQKLTKPYQNTLKK